MVARAQAAETNPGPREEVEPAPATSSVQLGVDEVKLLGPPREQPRRTWTGPEWCLLELLAHLPDDAGTEVVWRTLSP